MLGPTVAVEPEPSQKKEPVALKHVVRSDSPYRHDDFTCAVWAPEVGHGEGAKLVKLGGEDAGGEDSHAEAVPQKRPDQSHANGEKQMESGLVIGEGDQPEP